MSKVLECGAVVPGCAFIAHGKTEDDVLMVMIEHAHSIHDIDHISPQLRERIHAAIHDTHPKAAHG
jgi:predicted small metal-binding protein